MFNDLLQLTGGQRPEEMDKADPRIQLGIARHQLFQARHVHQHQGSDVETE